MKKRHMIIYRTILYLLLLILLFEGCNKNYEKNDEFAFSLKGAYQKLWLANWGLEYPPRQDILDLCKQGKDPSCLETYQYVQEGKETLLSKISSDPEKALSNTLDTICMQCEKNIEEIKDENKALETESVCFGALTALYFFDKDDQDKAILDRLLKQSSQVLSRIARHQFEWFHNRPEPERWTKAINKLSDEKLERWKKEAIIEEIEKDIKSIEKFGVML